MAMVFLGLIFIPSGLLGYLSWRAIENEKMFSQERLQESYRQFAQLAAREIDAELKQAESRWISVTNKISQRDQANRDAQLIDAFIKEEPLIAAGFLLTGVGQVAYPQDVSLRAESFAPESSESEAFAREHKVFTELVRQGNDLEYNIYDIEAAVATYREILAKVTNPQLRAMAESYVGRALMKQGDWPEALSTFQNLLAKYPEVRDVNNMYLRFLAQYQISASLESLDRDQEAVEVLLRLNRDLLERSDAIHHLQYSFFLERIQNLARRLVSSPKLSDVAAYKTQFSVLAEQNKKRRSQKYFLQLLDRQLTKMVIERKPYKARFRYLSDETDDEPYLLVYRAFPDASGFYTSGLIGIQVDLAQLSQQLFPAILRNLKFSEQVVLAIINEKGDHVIGTGKPTRQPIAARNLDTPFDFWQVTIALSDTHDAVRISNFTTTLGLWLIGLLVISIFFGAYIFIRRARREAYLSQMKSTFVSNVSHELRTPLASINMLAELLEMQLPGRSAGSTKNAKAGAQQYLGIIRRECERLRRLIESVLDFSKVERGLKQYNFEYEDPVAVLQTAAAVFRPFAEARGFVLATRIEDPLHELLMDADAISQVVLNLLSNAVRYSLDEKEILLSAHQFEALLVIEVVDHGVGIDSKEIPRIFEEFYRVDQRVNSQKQGGIGLGLTLVHHIVSAHSGDIRVDSEVGKGSTFTVTLPIAPPVNDTRQENGKAGAEARIDEHSEKVAAR